jgi:hypothetical protein
VGVVPGFSGVAEAVTADLAPQPESKIATSINNVKRVFDLILILILILILPS